MTRNQIAYQQNVETQRANVARETETARTNREQERLKRLEQTLTAARDQETARANVARERQNYLNYTGDMYNQGKNRETQRLTNARSAQAAEYAAQMGYYGREVAAEIAAEQTALSREQNAADKAADRSQLAYDKARERELRGRELDETKRHNEATEGGVLHKNIREDVTGGAKVITDFLPWSK